MIIAKLVEFAGRVRLVGNCLRWQAHRYREGSVVKIRLGLAAGMRWKRHHRYVNGYWIGHYELNVQETLRRELKVGGTFFDVGANAGFFTLVAVRIVGEQGKCVAFDPAPENKASIDEQIRLNSLPHCLAVQEAIADVNGTALFSFSNPGSPMGHLGASPEDAHIEVTVSTLDHVVSRFGPPDFIKMDIEGAEVKALAGGVRTVQEIRPGWLIELHGRDCERGVKNILESAGYNFFDLQGSPLNPEQAFPKHIIARHPDQTKHKA